MYASVYIPSVFYNGSVARLSRKHCRAGCDVCLLRVQVGVYRMYA